MSKYGISKNVDYGYEEAVEKTRQALAEEGFGILTEIDVKETLKKKLDKDFRKYIILGACNPPFAFEALSNELEIGLLLPCNVIVYENDEGGTTITAIDPIVAMGFVVNPSVEAVATNVRTKLDKVINRL